jgi:hypothetical protein
MTATATAVVTTGANSGGAEERLPARETGVEEQRRRER